MGQDYYCHYCHKSLECCKCDGQIQDDLTTAQERIAELEAENAKFRALVERGANLYDTDIQRAKLNAARFVSDCREALK